MFFFPCFDLVKPFARGAFLYVFAHLCDSFFCICNDRDIYLDISGNGCCVDINVDNLCMWCKLVKLSCDSVIESGSDGEKYITIADCHVCCISSVHTKVSDKERMVCRDSAFSHYCCNDRDICFLYYFTEDFVSAGDYNTAASQE